MHSLEAIYREHHVFVWRSLRGLGVPRSSVDDVAQDVFVIAAQRLAAFDAARGSLRAWLFGVTRVVARRHGERRARRHARRGHREVADVPGGTSTHRLSARPERVIARREAALLVEEFLAELGEEQRSVFFLKEVEGLSAPEIAQAIDRKLNTVYSRLRLARRRFDAFVAARGTGYRGEPCTGGRENAVRGRDRKSRRR